MSTKAVKNGEYTTQEIMVLDVSKLNKEGAVKAVKVWGQPNSNITHLVFYTTSRRDMPGPDHHLTKLLGQTHSIQHFQYQHGYFHEGTVLSLFRDFANKLSHGCGHALVVCSAFKAEDSPRSSEKVTKHQPSRTNTACHSKRVESHSQGTITAYSPKPIVKCGSSGGISASHHAQRTSPLQRSIAAAIGVNQLRTIRFTLELMFTLIFMLKKLRLRFVVRDSNLVKMLRELAVVPLEETVLCFPMNSKTF